MNPVVQTEGAVAPVASASSPVLIIYDGDCILCRNYARLVRLRETVGPVELINARSEDPRVARYWREGYDLDQGMLFVRDGSVYWGADAVHMLALLSGRAAWFNRLNAAIFSNRTAATWLYPLLKLARRLSLLAFGKGKLREPQSLDRSASG